MTAVCTRQVNDELQFTGCVVDILAFEGTFFGLVCPGEPLVDIHQPVNCATHSNDLPTS